MDTAEGEHGGALGGGAGTDPQGGDGAVLMCPVRQLQPLADGRIGGRQRVNGRLDFDYGEI
jgi:hypothetical protein